MNAGITDKKAYPPAFHAWLIWGLGATLFSLTFFQRVAPAVMTDRLMVDFNIGAAALGNLSAFYFYSYVAMQIPTGVLVDYLGPRRLLCVGSLIAAFGTFLFAAAPTVLFANLGRLFIGAAGGVAFVSTLKLATRWFPSHRFAMISGLTLACGTAGAVSAGVPLRFLVDHFGWRAVIFVSAAVTLVDAFAIWLMVHEDPLKKGSIGPDKTLSKNTAQTGLLAGFKSIFRYRNTWLLSIAAGGLLGPVLAFSGLWGVPYLSTHVGLSSAKSAAVASALLVALSVGGTALGAFSDKIGRRKPLYLVGSFIAIIGWALVIYIPRMPIWLLVSILTTVGFMSGALIIGFAFIKESVPSSLSGTATGVYNMGNMVGPMVLTPLIGLVLEQNWKGVMEKGVRIYDLASYQSGFAWTIVFTVLAIVMVALTKETNCRQMIAE
jgi:MFS family permease